MTAHDHPGRRSELNQGYRDLYQVIPDQMKGFGELHRSAVADGALTRASKELMAVAIAICMRCEDCLTLHMHDAIKAGATADMVHEAIGVALLMGGGPASTYATRALEAFEQFSA
ncbi:MAG TPA: carboxymuconolactone decarboxylase family protein [Ilumatobacter sp.]